MEVYITRHPGNALIVTKTSEQKRSRAFAPGRFIQSRNKVYPIRSLRWKPFRRNRRNLSTWCWWLDDTRVSTLVKACGICANSDFWTLRKYDQPKAVSVFCGCRSTLVNVGLVVDKTRPRRTSCLDSLCVSHYIFHSFDLFSSFVFRLSSFSTPLLTSHLLWRSCIASYLHFIIYNLSFFLTQIFFTVAYVLWSQPR